jgi:hypothetical protein
MNPYSGHFDLSWKSISFLVMRQDLHYIIFVKQFDSIKFILTIGQDRSSPNVAVKIHSPI